MISIQTAQTYWANGSLVFLPVSQYVEFGQRIDPPTMHPLHCSIVINHEFQQITMKAIRENSAATIGSLLPSPIELTCHKYHCLANVG